MALCNFGGSEISKLFSEFIVERQLSAGNRPDAFVEGAYTDAIIYPTFLKVATAMERHFSGPHRFMCGNAPTNIDFAFFGMFYQFVQDKIPRDMMIAQYPHINSWINRMNDTSGFNESDLKVIDLLLDLLKIAAGSYLVFLEANAARLNDDPDIDDMITVTIFDGEEDFSAVHSQKPYAYQAKCL